MPKSILLIDDDKVTLLQQKLELEKLNYNVETSCTFDDALHVFNNTTFDIILMDINLNEKRTGIDLAKSILKIRDTPIVFLSSYEEEDLINQTFEVGGYGYASKNSSPTILNASIKMAFKLYVEKQKLKQTQYTLNNKSTQLKMAMQAANIGSFDYYINDGLSLWSDELFPIFGIEKSSWNNKFTDYLLFIPKEERIYISKLIGDFIRSNSVDYINYSHEINKGDGTNAYIEVRAKLFRDINGNPERFTGIAIDITNLRDINERYKKSLEDKGDLLVEFQERANSSFAFVSSLVKLAMHSTSNKRDIAFLKKFSSRFKVVTNIYNLLYKHKEINKLDTALFIDKIVQDLKSKTKFTFSTDNDSFDLPVKTIIPLGIIVNEIISNSLEHAFENEEDGTVKISFLLEQGFPTLYIEDNGKGIQAIDNYQLLKTLGLKMVQTLCNQINGTFTLENHKGTHFMLQLPKINKI